jgi:hypothetical protein
MSKPWQWTLATVTILSLLLSACAAQPAAAPTQAPPTAAPVQPTAAPKATEAPKPTQAPTAQPTEAPKPTAAPTALPTTAPKPTEAPAAAWTAPAGALVAVTAEAAPKLDGKGDDAAWAKAPETVIPVAGGANHGSTNVALKSVYSGDMVYFLATWEDPTQSFIRAPWEKQADGTWKVMADPKDKGGDNNLLYEDKLAMIWNIAGSIKGFETAGCMGLCHVGENPDKKPFGNKYTPAAGQIGDIWHWKSVRNLNQLDDQYLDDTHYSADTPDAGRKSDAKESGGYVNNETKDKKLPAFMLPGGGSKDGAPGYILDSEKVAFDDALFKAGDKVPGIVKSAFVGDRGDIAAGWHWEDGKWTLEFGRKLDTGSKTDVQFDKLDGVNYFGLATFDNAQVRHAFQSGSTPFVFKP